MNSIFEKIRDEVLYTLEEKLPKYLTYHSVEHTKYVLKMAEYLAWREKVTEHEVFLIKVAALYHDIGFTIDKEEHEIKGCKIAQEELPNYGLSESEIGLICGMIMATKIPQYPKTQLEEILADADLEYLSTENFDPVSEMLFQEMKHFNPELSKKAWDDIQIDFLKNHSYHTNFCFKYKESFKHQHLLKLQGLGFESVSAPYSKTS